jgi:Flp pilus assembly protein TadG
MAKRLPKARRGHAVVEVALMAPWIFLLFAGALDYGFYAYAMISVENAARVAALHTSTSPELAANSDAACALILAELRPLPNIGDAVNGCAAAPLEVSAEAVTGADSSPASRVTITYETVHLIPIPGLRGQMRMTRTAEARMRGK